METNQIQFHCPKCGQDMGITDVSLGENYNMVFGLYCFVCKTAFNFAFTLGYFQQQFNAAYQKKVPLRPPLLLAPPLEFSPQDKNFLAALRIGDDSY